MERKPFVRILLAICVGLLVLPSAVVAQQFPLAPNDNYGQYGAFNEPGKRLNRTERLTVQLNTSQATIQGDVFNPPNSGGPPEPTTCDGVSYGKTVWYDFYPDVTGRVSLEASGFDNVIRVVPFNRITLVPNFTGSLCVNESSGATEKFLVDVLGRRSYIVQVGGVNNASGDLEFEFSFASDADRDQVFGELDDCPRFKGTAKRDGCPLRLRANTTLRALPTAGGVEIDRIAVSNNRRARVAVRCSGCGKNVKRGRSMSFPRLRGHELPAGSKLVIRATRRGAIGVYTAYKIVRGNFKKVERCMNPGSRKPRRKCG